MFRHLATSVLSLLLSLGSGVVLAAPPTTPRSAPPPRATPVPHSQPRSMPSRSPVQQHESRSQRWQHMSPTQRERVRERAQEFRNMDPVQRERVREARRYYQSLPAPRREQLQREWKQMSPSKRQQWIEQHHSRPTRPQRDDNGH